jgi:hypothetical protein
MQNLQVILDEVGVAETDERVRRERWKLVTETKSQRGGAFIGV